MFVCNAGMSCLFRNGDYWEEENRIDNLIHWMLSSMRWGNENVGLRYVKNYNRFYKAIKEKYPQIEVVCALMLRRIALM